MKISELIAELRAIKAEHGDLPVFHEEVDPYTGSDSEEDPVLGVAEAFDARRHDGTIARPYPRRVLINQH